MQQQAAPAQSPPSLNLHSSSVPQAGSTSLAGNISSRRLQRSFSRLGSSPRAATANEVTPADRVIEDGVEQPTVPGPRTACVVECSVHECTSASSNAPIQGLMGPVGAFALELVRSWCPGRMCCRVWCTRDALLMFPKPSTKSPATPLQPPSTTSPAPRPHRRPPPRGAGSLQLQPHRPPRPLSPPPSTPG